MLICIALFIVLLLQTLDFSECVIEHIDRKAFGNLGNSIETISLKGNKLRSLQVWIKCCDLSCSQLQIVVFEINNLLLMIFFSINNCNSYKSKVLCNALLQNYHHKSGAVAENANSSFEKFSRVTFGLGDTTCSNSSVSQYM